MLDISLQTALLLVLVGWVLRDLQSAKKGE